MPPSIRGPTKKNSIAITNKINSKLKPAPVPVIVSPPPAPVIVTPPPVPTTTNNNRRVRPVRTKPLPVTQSPQFRKKGIQRTITSTPPPVIPVIPPTNSLLTNGPVLKEITPSVVTTPNIFLPPTTTTTITQPTETLLSNPLYSSNGGSINQPSIMPIPDLPLSYDSDSNSNNNTMMLIVVGAIVTAIVIKKM